MNDDATKRAQFEVDWAIKNRFLMDLPAQFLRFLADVESNPTPENLERIHKWNLDVADYLQKKAAQPISQPRPEMFVVGQQFLN